MVTLNADFLGTWGDNVWYTGEWAKTRRPEDGEMSVLHAFESGMSLTGSNADRRTRVKPSQQGNVAAALLNEINGQGHVAGLDEAILAGVKSAAADLKAAGSKGLVVAGDNDAATQCIVNAINVALGPVGTTVEFKDNANLFKGTMLRSTQLVADMQAGAVSALIVDGLNPAYTAVDAAGFKAGLEKVAFSVSTALFADETASRCTAMAPNHHWLESWNDLQIDPNRIDLVQPSIQPLYDTRHATESLLAWAGNSTSTLTPSSPDAQRGLQCGGHVHRPGLEHGCPQRLPRRGRTGSHRTGVRRCCPERRPRFREGPFRGAFELDLYRKVTMGDGQQAGNPMLQETSQSPRPRGTTT